MAPKTVKNTDDQAKVQAAEEAAAAELPPAGHQRRETLKARDERLQIEAERIAEQIIRGSVDPSKLEIINDIASKTEQLNVSNPQPGFVYAWMSINQHGHHISRMENLGWVVVQGDDPEALELKGSGRGAGVGSPGTHRQLGDVILMKIPRERYLVLRAREIARTKQIQQSSAATLAALGEQFRGKGLIVKPFGMKAGDDFALAGPEIKPGRFTSRQKALDMVDSHLREGTVPGMELNQ